MTGMEVVVAAIVMFFASIAVGVIAKKYHGRGAFSWFFLSLIVTPVLALLFLLAISGPAVRPEGAGEGVASEAPVQERSGTKPGRPSWLHDDGGVPS